MIWSGGMAWIADFPDPSNFYGPILGCAGAVPGRLELVVVLQRGSRREGGRGRRDGRSGQGRRAREDVERHLHARSWRTRPGCRSSTSSASPCSRPRMGGADALYVDPVHIPINYDYVVRDRCAVSLRLHDPRPRSIISAGTTRFAPALNGWRRARPSSSSAIDASAGQLGAGSTVADVATLDFGKINPVTGPIFVEGAEPGDALKVTIDELQAVGLRLDGQHSGLRPARRPVHRTGAARLELRSRQHGRRPLFGPHGRVPLKPFAGTIGCAPAEPGLHSVVPPRRVGGNLDIRDLAAGTTLYLPVEVAGALFSVGDTHAAQGDGEVCGTAIESPMDVVLTLDLVKDAQPEDAALHHAGPGDAPSRRQGLRGDDRHRAGPDGRRARAPSAEMVDLLGAALQHERRSTPTCWLDLRRSADHRDRRHAELGRVVLLPARASSSERSAPASPGRVAGRPRDRVLVRRGPDRRRPRRGAATRRWSRTCPSTLGRGETLCIAGESGSGKSMTALAIMGLLPQPAARIAGGSIRLGGTDLATLDEARDAAHARRPHRHDLPGADDLAQPGADDRPAADRGDRGAHRRCRAARRAQRAIEALDAVRIPQAETPAEAVSARAVRRHAPARDDRHGAGAASPTC